MKYFLMFVTHGWMTIFVTTVNGCKRFILFTNFLSIIISPWWRNMCGECNDNLNLPLSFLINLSYQRTGKRFLVTDILCVLVIVKNKNSEIVQTFFCPWTRKKEKHRVFPLATYDPSNLLTYVNELETAANMIWSLSGAYVERPILIFF